MNILGIETSCDETAVAVVKDGHQLLSNVVATQIDIHKVFGGVVPEVAARSHIEVMLPVVDEALEEAFPGVKDKWQQIDAVAVTNGPGLSGSLLIGVITARTLALIKDKPLYGVNHVLGHVYANFISSEGSDAPSAERNKSAHLDEASGDSLRQTVQDSLEVSQYSSVHASSLPRDSSSPISSEEFEGLDASSDTNHEARDTNYYSDTSNKWIAPAFPLLALIVSGGHSQLALFKDHYDYRLLGQTQDDAVGEAFDKVAKVLGLEYPGGPSIQKSAQAGGNPNKYHFPSARLENPYDFSFSGLKTAVLRQVQIICGKDHTFPSFELAELLSDEQVKDVAASFQKAAVETLVNTTLKAYREFSPKTVVIAGGVAANTELRRRLSEKLPIDIAYAPMNLCTDNAAMIASLGYFHAQKAKPDNPRFLEINTSLKM